MLLLDPRFDRKALDMKYKGPYRIHSIGKNKSVCYLRKLGDSDDKVYPWNVRYIRKAWDLRPSNTLLDVPPAELAKDIENFDSFTAKDNNNFQFDCFHDPDQIAVDIHNKHNTNDIFTEPDKQNTKTSSENDNEFEVEHILNHRIVNGTDQYLIKWKGFASDENSLEPVSNLNCPQLLQDYWQHSVRTRDLKPMNIPSREAYKSPSHLLVDNIATHETDTLITPPEDDLSSDNDPTVELMTPQSNSLDTLPIVEQTQLTESPDRLPTLTQPRRSNRHSETRKHLTLCNSCEMRNLELL